MVITSPANPRVKALVRLRRRRERDSTGTFLIEGYREINRALEGDVEMEAVFACPELYLGENEPALVERAAATGAEVVMLSDEPFRKASYRDRPEGVIAVARQFATGLDRIPAEDLPLILVVEAIEKPGNLGTMLRTAEAAGVTGVIVADPATDPFNPNVVRASLGTLFSVPLSVTDTPGAIAYLGHKSIGIVVTTPDGDVPHHDAPLGGAVAVVVGSEQFGLSEAWLQAAQVQAVIPMPGSMDSLNAAMAAGIVLFEALRQRQQL